MRRQQSLAFDECSSNDETGLQHRKWNLSLFTVCPLAPLAHIQRRARIPRCRPGTRGRPQAASAPGQCMLPHRYIGQLHWHSLRVFNGGIFECRIVWYVGRLYNEDACVAYLSCAQPSAPAAAPHWQTSRLFSSPATYPPKQSRCSDLNALLSTPLALALTRRLLHCLTCRCHVFPHQHLPCIQCKRARVLQHFFENSTLQSTSRPRYSQA